ncbi:MAG: preprotein translocase subunit YajC [Elusimicrobia bacterium RIFOXYA2_FULL_39_19]|nr:MAG: preprotein translocase subunit YajC [Elusimicrobia bacterium RIFOXYA2_FULL_39_19]
MISLLYAQTPGAVAGDPAGAFSSIIPFVVIFFIFYFLLIRPQQKKDKEHKKLLNALKKGDNVVTSGGIYGSIISVKPDVVEMKIDENTKIQILKSAIAQVLTPAAEIEKKAV